MFLAKVWYFCTSAGSVFVLPYFNIFFSDTLRFNKEQIGALSALRPWLSAACQVLLCSLADWMGAHTAMLVLTFAVSVLLRCLLIVMPPQFVAVAALVLAADCIGSPIGAIVDATVVGACKNDGDYGKHRMWGSIGWGGLSVAAGWLVGSKGLIAGFAVYCALSMPCIFIAWKLRNEAAAAAAQADNKKATTAEATTTKTLPAIAVPCNKHCYSTHEQTVKQSSKTLTATILCSTDPDGLADGLHARLLQGTPNSSCAGSEYGGSTCSGSRPGTPDLSMFPQSPLGKRCESPFSRFAQGEDLPDVYPTESPASPFAVLSNRGLVAGTSSPQAAGSSRRDGNGEEMGVLSSPATDDDRGFIKAVYATAGNNERQQLQEAVGPDQQQATAQATSVVPALAAAHLSLAATIDAEGVSEAAPAVSAVKAVTQSQPVAPKHSAQLDRGSLEGPVQFQTTHNQLKPVQEEQCNKMTIATVNQPEDEGAPLLSSLVGKQPLSTDDPSQAAADIDAAGQSSVTVASLLLKPAVLVFLWRALIIGLGLGAIGNFLFLHVEALGGTGTLMGLMLAFNILTEAPAFHFQTYIMDKMSVPFVFNASMLMLSLRLAGYGLLPWLHSPWPVLLLELMHGFTFATSWGAGIVHCKRLAPAHLNASMQGLFSSLYGGLGSGLGALLGGFLMEALGGQGLFFVCSLVVLAGWLLGFVVELLLTRTDNKQAAEGNVD